MLARRFGSSHTIRMGVLRSYNLIGVNTSLTRKAAAAFPPEFCRFLHRHPPHHTTRSLMIDPKPAMLLLAALALGGCDLTSRGTADSDVTSSPGAGRGADAATASSA